MGELCNTDMVCLSSLAQGEALDVQTIGHSAQERSALVSQSNDRRQLVNPDGPCGFRARTFGCAASCTRRGEGAVSVSLSRSGQKRELIQAAGCIEVVDPPLAANTVDSPP
jgi:hypothetical protein